MKRRGFLKAIAGVLALPLAGLAKGKEEERKPLGSVNGGDKALGWKNYTFRYDAGDEEPDFPVVEELPPIQATKGETEPIYGIDWLTEDSIKHAWTNYNAAYTDVSKQDLVDSMRKAMEQAEFVPPRPKTPDMIVGFAPNGTIHSFPEESYIFGNLDTLGGLTKGPT